MYSPIKISMISKYKNFALKNQIYVMSCQVKQNLPVSVLTSLLSRATKFPLMSEQGIKFGDD